ncbi:hypothetical protein [Flavobacterium sp.]|jgi:hypothetical protein|uniref:hypothetical protein n=1 Tax=Flavobacterium sp. TaxID=239 RepID=UPI0037BE2321
MGRSYFPTADAAQTAWASNYKAKIAEVASTLGLTQEQADNQKSKCDTIMSSISNVAAKRADLKEAIGIRDEIIATNGGSLRADISNIKTLPGYNAGIGNALGIISIPSSKDYATFKPTLTIGMFGGKVRIKFKKMETDGVNIYRKKIDATEWSFLARANKSPFDQSFVLDAPGQIETWQYRAFGVVNDNEVGLPSDIVQVVYLV